MVYVTHDQVEAMTLADRIVVLKDGYIMQVGSPRTLYEKPDNLFVAQFIGSPKMNVLPCETSGGQYRIPGHGTGPYDRAGQAVNLGIRPEHIGLTDPEGAVCTGRVEVAEYLGADTYLYLDCGQAGQVNLRTTDVSDDIRGKTVGLVFDPARLHFFGDDENAL